MKQDFYDKRKEMVQYQLVARGINQQSLLDAFINVPRHRFVLPQDILYAYQDHPLPIGQGQTISQPFMVASMTQYLELKKTDKVLEIGTGSGFQTAILAELAGMVYSIERHSALTEKADNILKELGYKNIKLKTGDGSFGWPEFSPYNAIILTCAVPAVGDDLKKQLENKGRIIAPVGAESFQTLTLIRKTNNIFKEEKFFDCRFVPLIGEYGYKK